ncbi:MAG: HAMP domain-containing histidine kinase, partial [Alphaproteobacteria bacterium]|nr:HAMP domain-containing histidine kinase [Alphaproteobacteria bacterium]
GEKGMGHFAVQKLGNHIKISSNPMKYDGREMSGHAGALELTIDWSRYEPGMLFDEVENEMRLFDSDVTNHGVTLEITDLKYKWTQKDVEAVQRVLGNLLVPSRIRKSLKHSFMPTVHAHGFYLEGEVESTLEKYPAYRIKAKLRDKSIYYEIERLDHKSEKLASADPIKDAESKGIIRTKATCGDADLEISNYRDPVQKKVALFSKRVMKANDILNQLKDNCGIKIFNDGIRVMPYGDPGNDWLELDIKFLKRYRGNIRNDQSIGYIFLTREKNPRIIETTTRQGIIENREFESLKEDFVLEVIKKLGKYISAENQQLEENRKKEHFVEKADIMINRLSDFIGKLELSTEDKVNIKDGLGSVKSMIRKEEADAKKKIEEITIGLEMYRNLATLGTSALSLHHEIVTPLTRIRDRQGLMLEKWNQWDDEKKIDYVNKNHDDADMISSLNTYIRSFASLFKGPKGTKREKRQINMDESLDRLQEGLKRILKQHDIHVERKTGLGTLPTILMDQASLESIILNLVGNSIKALLKVKRDRKVISIEYGREQNDLVMRIYDNGYGIRHEDFSSVFDAFWTTSKGSSERGTGMGLAIASELVRDGYGGKIRVEKSTFEEEEPGKGETTFIIRIPLERLREI